MYVTAQTGQQPRHIVQSTVDGRADKYSDQRAQAIAAILAL
jgi:hypothetical protein